MASRKKTVIMTFVPPLKFAYLLLRCIINLRYKNLASMYPAQVDMAVMNSDHQPQDIPNEAHAIITAFKSQPLLEAYRAVFS